MSRRLRYKKNMIPQEILEKEFATHEQALQLKQLGFNEVCISVYSEKDELSPLQNMEVRNSNVPSYCTAPLRQQVFRWFREKHDLVGFSLPYSQSDEPPFIYIIAIRSLVNNYDLSYDSVIGEEYTTHEDAELACIDKLIETIKNKE